VSFLRKQESTFCSLDSGSEAGMTSDYHGMNFASLISRIFDPFIGFTFLFFLSAIRSGIAGWDLVTLMSILFITMILPPALLLFWAVKTKRISNWDISDRSQRVRALLVLGVFLFCDYFIMQFLGTPLMKQLFVFLINIFFGFFLITLRFKLSGHMATATLILLFLFHWYGWIMVPLFFLLPLLAWSRITLKRHTVGEVVGGFLYSLVIFFIARGLHLV
jgi:membrane-associated phospholipid phosphatase